jgi:hypothetical protein
MKTANNVTRPGRPSKVSRVKPEKDLSPRTPKEPDASTYNGRVAVRIRELRNKRGQAVDEFLQALEQQGLTVNRSLAYAWENGSKLIHPNHYPAIAAALGCRSVRAFLPEA